MYDYLAKVILVGPSGTGKYVNVCPPHIFGLRLDSMLISDPRIYRSCLLHRFVKDECTVIHLIRLGGRVFLLPFFERTETDKIAAFREGTIVPDDWCRVLVEDRESRHRVTA